MITQIEIINFLSFAGEFKVRLQSFTGLFSCHDKGLNHFFLALQYGLGVDLGELGYETLDVLAANCIRVEPTIEVGIVLEDLKMSRSIRDGYEVFKINGQNTSFLEYKNALAVRGYNCFASNGCFISSSDIQNAFDDEGLEHLVTQILGSRNLFEEIQRERRSCNSLKLIHDILVEKKFISMKSRDDSIGAIVDDVNRKLHILISKNSDILERIRQEHDEVDLMMDTNEQGDLIIDDEMLSVDISESIEVSSSSREISIGGVVNETSEEDSQEERSVLENKLAENIQEITVFQASLKYTEWREAQKSKDEARLLSVQSQLENDKNNLEARILSLTTDHEILEKKLHRLSYDIGSSLSSLQENNMKDNFRLSKYCRVADRISTSDKLWVIRLVLGDDVYQAHLVDTIEDGFTGMQCVRGRMIERRLHFLPLSNINPQLCNLLFETGDERLTLNTWRDVLKLLSKFKDSGLVSSLPLIIRHGGITEEWTELEVDDLLVFAETKEFIRGDGLFGRMDFGNDDPVNTNDVIMEISSLRIREEEYFVARREISNEILDLRRQVVGIMEEISLLTQPSSQPSTYERFEPQLDPIYEVYAANFPCFPAEESSSLPVSTTLNAEDAAERAWLLESKLQRLKNKQSKILHAIDELNRSDREAFVHAIEETPRWCPFIQSPVQTNFSLLVDNLKMRELRNVVSNEDMESYEGNREFRSIVFRKLVEDVKAAEKTVRGNSKLYERLKQQRLELLLPFVDSCNDFLRTYLKDFMGEALEAAELILKPLIPLNLQVKVWGLFQTYHSCNTFIKFVTLLVIIIHLARFRGLPFLVLDKMDQFYPNTNEDVGPALNVDDLNVIDQRLTLLQRFGLFLKSLLTLLMEGLCHKKGLVQINNSMNALGKFLTAQYSNTQVIKECLSQDSGPVQHSEESSSGSSTASCLEQIIVVSMDDVLHSTDSHIWIVKDVYRNGPNVHISSKIMEPKFSSL